MNRSPINEFHIWDRKSKFPSYLGTKTFTKKRNVDSRIFKEQGDTQILLSGTHCLLSHALRET